MNSQEHLPFEEWLLAGDPLAPAQQAELNRHLEGCPECQQLAAAWHSVVNTMTAIPEVDPMPGFSLRWQVQLARKRALHHRRITAVIMTVFIVALLAILIGLSLPAVGGLPTPIQILAKGLTTLTVTLDTFRDVRDVLQVIFSNIPLAGPLLIWIVLSTSLALWSIVWMAIIWRLPNMIRSRYEART